MAFRFLLPLVLSTYLSIVAYTAAPPVNGALHQALQRVDTAPSNASAPKNLALLTEHITFPVPGTQTKLIFSRFANLISQSDLDLCVIEGIVSTFNKVLARGSDGFLPLNSVDYKYGNVVINVYDFSAPSFRMTNAMVVSTLRGLALFSSIQGYYAASFDVYDVKKGHVGTGEMGPIIP